MNALIYVANNFKLQRVPALFLHMNGKKYMINFPENVQRFLKDNGMRIEKNSKLFITGHTPDHFLGILGMLQTLTGLQLNDGIKIYSLRKTLDLLLALKYQLGAKFLGFSYLGLGVGQPDRWIYGYNSAVFPKIFHRASNHARIFSNWEAECKLFPPAVMARLNDPRENCETSHPVIPENLIKACSLRIIKDGLVEVVMIPLTDPASGDCHLSLLFIVGIGEEKPGPAEPKGLDPAASEQAKLLNNKRLGAQGRTIALDQISRSEGPFSLLILDLPSKRYVQELSESPFIRWLLDNHDKNFELKYLLHLAAAETALDESYRLWLESEKVRSLNHVFVHASLDEEFNLRPHHMYFLRYRCYYQLISKYFPFFFPKAPVSLFNNLPGLNSIACNKTVYRSFFNLQARKQAIRPNPFSVLNLKELERIPLALNSAMGETYHAHQHVIRKPNELNNFPFFIALGTGSRCPTAYRSVSSVLFAVNESCYGLFDCGEGTLYQLAEQFGDAIDDALLKLRLVLITHIHGDHFYGILNLISKRAEAIKRLGKSRKTEKLFVCLPENCLSFVLAYLESFNDSDTPHVCLITNQDIVCHGNPNDKYLNNFEGVEDGEFRFNAFCLNYHNNLHERHMRQYKRLFAGNVSEFMSFLADNGVETVLPVPVLHCPESAAFVVRLKNKKIVYSGDCRTTMQLAHYGQNADLLIHEATFDCSFDAGRAVAQGHSTIEHALKMGISMKAKITCLTHFSQRHHISPYRKNEVPIALPNNTQLLNYFWNNTIMLQDHLYFDFDSLSTLQRINPVFNYSSRFVIAEEEALFN